MDANLVGMNGWLFALNVVLGLFLVVSPGVAQDFEKGMAAARAAHYADAVAEWRPLAKDGHAESQFSLGVAYERGLGVAVDLAEAARWYAMAAGQGHAQSQYNLGLMYADGRGLSQDDVRSATWMRKAAEQDHGRAQYNLGVLYKLGRGVARDPEEARVWFDKAAANGVDAALGGDDKTLSDATAKPERVPEAAAGRSAVADASAAAEIELLKTTDKTLNPEIVVEEVKSIGLSLVDPSFMGIEEARAPLLRDGPLRIMANFPVEANYQLEVLETRKRERDGGILMARTSAMDVDMVVKAGSGEGVLVEWIYGPAIVRTAGDPNNGLLASELGKLIDGQKVAYRTNEAGEIIGLEDPSELTSFYEESIERVLSEIDEQFGDPELLDSVRARLAPLLSPDYASSRALDLPALLHFFGGRELVAGKTYSEPGTMSLPPTADALPATLEYELKWFDRAAGIAWLRWRQSVDPEEVAAAVLNRAQESAAQSGQPAPAELDIGPIEVSDGADYEIDVETGLPTQVIYTRTIELFGFLQTEKRRIRIVREDRTEAPEPEPDPF